MTRCDTASNKIQQSSTVIIDSKFIGTMIDNKWKPDANCDVAFKKLHIRSYSHRMLNSFNTERKIMSVLPFCD